MYQPGKIARFMRTTAIGGLMFLLPLVVVGAAIGQVAPVVMTIAESIHKLLPGLSKIPGGIALLILLAIVILLLICFVAGILARRSFIHRLSEWFEKKITLLFPRYAILKDQMADSIGSDQTKADMKPVVVRFDDHMQVGFETERNDQVPFVSVYLPGSPDPWAGRVVLVESERIEPLDVHFGVAVGTCEQLGRGSAVAYLGEKAES